MSDVTCVSGVTPAAVGCDLSSASECENDDSEDSDSNLRDMSRYHCRHCFTTCEYRRHTRRAATRLRWALRGEKPLSSLTAPESGVPAALTARLVII